MRLPPCWDVADYGIDKDKRAGQREPFGGDVVRSTTRFRGMGLGLLEAEVLARLCDGRRTINQLASDIFGLSSGARDHVAEYYRVRRALGALEDRGLVSPSLLGKERRYGLTKRGIACIAGISEKEYGARGIISRFDLLLYTTSLGLAAAVVLGSEFLDLAASSITMLTMLFLLTAGASFVRLAESLVRAQN